MADLEANFMHLQLMHESLARFGESFAAFLYGLNVRAFCVDFPEAPVAESFERWRSKMENSGIGAAAAGVLGEGETTFM
jgi:DASH complex subunit DAM1